MAKSKNNHDSNLTRPDSHMDTTHGNKGSDHGHHSDNAVSFTFNDDNSGVLTKTNSSGTELDITNSIFTTNIGANDLGNTAVISVTETRTLTNAVKTEVYSDQDGDASYNETFDLTVETATNTHSATHQFTFNDDGSIATDSIVLNNGNTRADTINSNEVYQQMTVDSVVYVTKTTTTTDGNYQFEIFRDDNADGTWTEVAEGHSKGLNIDTDANAVSLTGIQSLLSAADSIVG